DLVQMALTIDATCRLSRLLNGREHKPDQCPDETEHDDQFYQGKARSLSTVHILTRFLDTRIVVNVLSLMQSRNCATLLQRAMCWDRCVLLDRLATASWRVPAEEYPWRASARWLSGLLRSLLPFERRDSAHEAWIDGLSVGEESLATQPISAGVGDH